MTKTINLSQKHLQQSFIQQHDQSDCGVACLLSLIQYYGGSNNLEKLRELSGTTKQGTTLLGLYQAANKLGFTKRIIFFIKKSRRNARASKTKSIIKPF